MEYILKLITFFLISNIILSFENKRDSFDANYFSLKNLENSARSYESNYILI